jgi:hypothetical protein
MEFTGYRQISLINMCSISVRPAALIETECR